MRTWPWIAAAAAVVASPFVVQATRRRMSSVETADHVNLRKFAGTWYEFARFPRLVERNTYANRMVLTLNPDDTYTVSTEYRRGGPDGDLKRMEGTIRSTDPQHRGRFELRNNTPLWVPFWVVALDENYKWAAISDPLKSNLWILSRTPDMDEGLYAHVVVELERRGWNVSKLVRSQHPKGLRKAMERLRAETEARA